MPIHCDTHIETKRLLDAASYKQILALQHVCEEADDIAFKLELAYKLADAGNLESNQTDPAINEFMFYVDRELIGYVGICGFGEASGPLELSGMVHPDYRRNGIFKTLSALAEAECNRRKTKSALGLCDRKALAGQAMLKNHGRTLHHSEYEMHLQSNPYDTTDETLHGISLRKAENSDAAELARQDSIYFGEEFSVEPENEKAPHIRLPEEEEKKGFTIYLAVKDNAVIGKVNLQISNDSGGIFGLGVLPAEQGKGYGRATLRLAVKKLQEAQVKTIYLQVLTDNEKALTLYRSCGFETSSVMDYFKL